MSCFNASAAPSRCFPGEGDNAFLEKVCNSALIVADCIAGKYTIMNKYYIIVQKP